MKTKTKFKNILLAFMAVVLIVNLSACSGEDGTDGINGIDGVDGQDGVDGVDGQDGQDGNVNVMVSDWFQLQYDNKSGANPPTWGTMILPNEDIPEVDLEEFIEVGGIALVYLKGYEGLEENDYIILPLPHINENVSYTNSFHYFQSVFSLVIRVDSPDISRFENTPNITFRYVLVPATTAQAFNLNSGNIPETFGEIATLFGLEE